MHECHVNVVMRLIDFFVANWELGDFEYYTWLNWIWCEWRDEDKFGLELDGVVDILSWDFFKNVGEFFYGF